MHLGPVAPQSGLQHRYGSSEEPCGANSHTDREPLLSGFGASLGATYARTGPFGGSPPSLSFAMFVISSSLIALLAVSLLLTAVWAVHLRDRDASIVDPVWGIAIWTVGFTYAVDAGVSITGARLVALLLAGAWALRLALHLHVRHGIVGEDRRYRAMREKRGDDWWWRSFYVVFLLQALLAWVVALPLMAAVTGSSAPGVLSWIGLGLAAIGFIYESVADGQLAHYQYKRALERKSAHLDEAGVANADRGVMDGGLWRYSRHPNYFGEMVFWWGMGLAAAGQGLPWGLLGSGFITFMLLKVSGVSLTEANIADRRPAYRDYVHRTNAVIPGIPGSK